MAVLELGLTIMKRNTSILSRDKLQIYLFHVSRATKETYNWAIWNGSHLSNYEISGYLYAWNTLEENIVLKWEMKYANYYYPSLIPHILPGKK